MSRQTDMWPFRNGFGRAANPHRNDDAEEFTAWRLANILLTRMDCFAPQLAVAHCLLFSRKQQKR